MASEQRGFFHYPKTTSLGTIAPCKFFIPYKPRPNSIDLRDSIVTRTSLMPSPRCESKSQTTRPRLTISSPRAFGPKLERSFQLPSSPGTQPCTIPDLEISVLSQNKVDQNVKRRPRLLLPSKNVPHAFRKEVDSSISRVIGICVPAESNTILPEHNQQLQDRFVKWQIGNFSCQRYQKGNPNHLKNARRALPKRIHNNSTLDSLRAD